MGVFGAYMGHIITDHFLLDTNRGPYQYKETLVQWNRYLRRFRPNEPSYHHLTDLNRFKKKSLPNPPKIWKLVVMHYYYPTSPMTLLLAMVVPLIGNNTSGAAGDGIVGLYNMVMH